MGCARLEDPLAKARGSVPCTLAPAVWLHVGVLCICSGGQSSKNSCADSSACSVQVWEVVWLPHGKYSWGFSGGWNGFAIDHVSALLDFSHCILSAQCCPKFVVLLWWGLVPLTQPCSDLYCP